MGGACTRWFKYDRDYLCVKKSQFVPVIFEPPCNTCEAGEVHAGFWQGNLRPLGRPRCRWEDNIKMDLQAVGWRGMDWIDVPEDRDR